jgi:hypothetical protein
MNLPANLPPLPPVPPGFDRWEYRGSFWKPKRECIWAIHDDEHGWLYDEDDELTEPVGLSPSHYIEAVRDEPATPSAQLFATLDPENDEELGDPAKDQPAPCTECVQGYVQETGFDRCEKCNPATR